MKLWLIVIFCCVQASLSVKPCGYTTWSCWSHCDASCGDKVQSRERSCTNPPPSLPGYDCSGLGPSTEVRECYGPIDQINLDGGYNSWGLWSECTKDCGGGIQYRTRWCVDPHPQGKGKECSEQKELGPAIKSRSCNEHDCTEEPTEEPTTEELSGPLTTEESSETPTIVEVSTEAPTTEESSAPTTEESAEEPTIEEESTETPTTEQSSGEPTTEELTEPSTTEESSEAPTREESTEALTTEESSGAPTTEESTVAKATEESTEVATTEESKEAPTTEESSGALTTEESTEATAMEQSSRGPTTEESTEEPATEESTEVPTTEESKEEPTTEESSGAPTTEESTEATATEQSSRGPTTEESTEEPATEESTEVPTTEESKEEPTTEESSGAPTTEESTEAAATKQSSRGPTTEESAEEPATEESTEVPTTEESKEKPTTEESSRAPTTEESTEATATEQSSRGPTTEESTEEPATEESTEVPKTEESKEEPTTEESSGAPTTEESTKATVTEELTQVPTKKESTEAPTTKELTEAPTTKELTEAPTAEELTEATTRAKPTTGLPCTKVVDLGIIIDKSKSVGKRNFKKLIKSLESFVHLFDVSAEGTHVGMISFNNDAELLFNFKDDRYHTENQLKERIKEIPLKLELKTRTDLALTLAKEKLFSVEGGDRPNVPNALIIFTDGKSTGKPKDEGFVPIPQTVKSLEEVKKVHMIVVGIGRGIKDSELKTLAGETGNFLHPVDFDHLPYILGKLKDAACETEATATEESTEVSTTKELTEAPSTKELSESPTAEQLTKAPTMAEPTTGLPCTKAVDLGIIIDKSKSVGKRNLKKLIKSLESFVRLFDVSAKGTHVGMISFNDDAELLCDFKDDRYHTENQLKKRIKEIPLKLELKTRTDLALTLAKEKLFSVEGGDRSDVPNALIIFTDGKSTGKPKDEGFVPIPQTVKSLEEDKKVRMIVVGIGKGIKDSELKTLAGEKGHYLHPAGFSVLPYILGKLKDAACADDKTDYINGGSSSYFYGRVFKNNPGGLLDDRRIP